VKDKPTEDDRTGGLQVDLKYCERCGGLWLRPAGSKRVYCVGCEPEMAQLPLVTGGRNRTRAPMRPGRGKSPVAEVRNHTLNLDAAGGAA
jgi:hypothetical protein